MSGTSNHDSPNASPSDSDSLGRTRSQRLGKLDRIADWAVLVFETRFCPGKLAERCGVGLRQLQRHMRQRFGTTPHAFIQSLRLNAAREMLQSGASVKETALSLEYKQASHFSRCFYQQFGFRPSTTPIFLQRKTGPLPNTSKPDTNRWESGAC